MEMRGEIQIDATPAQAWDVLGERFGQVAQWAAPILTSRLVADATVPAEGEPAPSVGIARVCGVDGFGPVPAGEVLERLTVFDRHARRLEYEAERGTPRIVRSAVNRWSVHPLPGDDAGCVVRMHATLRLAWWATPLAPVMDRQLRRGARQVLQDLRHWVETGQHATTGASRRESV
jgi:hypothetical protein